MEDVIEEKLDQRQFPFLSNRPMGGAGFGGSRSVSVYKISRSFDF
jgi:hypothetical protein